MFSQLLSTTDLSSLKERRTGQRARVGPPALSITSWRASIPSPATKGTQLPLTPPPSPPPTSGDTPSLASGKLSPESSSWRFSPSSPPPSPSGNCRRRSSASSESTSNDRWERLGGFRNGTQSRPEFREPSPRQQLMPALGEVKIGEVYHFPQRENLDLSKPSGYLQGLLNLLGQKLENHPVVVVGVDEVTGTVLFRSLTSFTDSTGSHGIPDHKSEASRKRMALCDNKNQKVTEHDGTRRLTMEATSDVFEKPTYINFYNNRHEVEYHHLRPWMTEQCKPIRFDQESIQRIKAGCPF